MREAWVRGAASGSPQPPFPSPRVVRVAPREPEAHADDRELEGRKVHLVLVELHGVDEPRLKGVLFPIPSGCKVVLALETVEGLLREDAAEEGGLSRSG